MSGTEINNINQRYYEGKAHLFWIVFNGKLRMNFTHNSGTARVFYWRMKLLGITIHKREKNISTNSSVGSLENAPAGYVGLDDLDEDRKSTRLNSSHVKISYAVFCLKK